MREFAPLLVLLLAGVVLSGTPLAAEEKRDGQLKQARDEVRTSPHPSIGKPSPPSSPASSSTSLAASAGGADTGGSTYQKHGNWTLFGWLFPTDETTPYQPPIYHELALLDYPYADGQRGWFFDYVPAPPVGEQPVPEPTRMSSIPGTIRGEYTNCGDGLNRYAGALQISLSILRLETEWQRYLEDLPSGATDSLTLGTLGLGLAFPLHDTLVLIVGAGASCYHDGSNEEFGWYGKVGTEIFPIRPLILNAELWGSYIRSDEFDAETFLGGGRATLGLIWNRFEVFGGWQATWIDSVTLDGPTAGVRIWF